MVKNMYIKKQKYKNSCFPCALQIALVNVGNLSPDNGDELEDNFNTEMLQKTGYDLNTHAPNESLVHEIISSLDLRLDLHLGNGFLVGPTELSGCEQYYADRINNAIAANENVAFVIGVVEAFGHAYAIFRDDRTRKWCLVDSRMDMPNVIDRCDNIRAKVKNGGIVFSEGESVIAVGNLVMMVTREH